MKAFQITKFGEAEKAFVLKDLPDPVPGPTEVGIKVEAFGLNYADVMARKGMYRDCPPLPAVIGYEVVGRIDKLGAEVSGLEVGQRVVAFTRFGGYATYAVTGELAVTPIPEDMDAGVASALATQYCTAWWAGEEVVRLNKGDHVLIQAAAGGVGTALVQIAKRHGCIVYGTAGSAKKIEYLKELGVDHPINYRENDFYEVIKKMRGEEGLDVVFDSLGAKPFKKGFKLLGHGGRIVGYGASSRSNGGRHIIAGIRTLLGFGFYSSAFLLMGSKSILGVNMLRIADHRPHYLKKCLENVVKLTDEGVFKPTVGGRYSFEKLAEAHRFLEERRSIGKIVVKW